MGIGWRGAVVVAIAAIVLGLSQPLAAHGAVLDAPGCRTLPVPADGPLRSAEARGAFGVDGTGVTVGIISNSFDTSGDEQDAAADVRDGVLPGPGNPCGRTQPVRVVIESPVSQDDEGRAMAQLVHGIAPGAELVFAAAGGMSEGDVAYVAAIEALVAAGADVIVDDVPGTDEPAFQRGAIGSAAQAAVDAGVLYVAAAGNDSIVGAADRPSAGHPIGAWATDAYRPMECPAEIAALYPPGTVDCMDFDPGAGHDAVQSLVLAPHALVLPRLTWAEPFDGVMTTFEHVMLRDGTTPVRSRMEHADRPRLQAAFVNSTDDFAEQGFAIVRRLDIGQPGTPAIRWVVPSLPFPTIVHQEYFRSEGGDVAGATIIGHESDPAVVSVAAVDVRTLTAETFSALGPARFDFGPVRRDGLPADRLPEPLVIPGPTVAGVQRLPISFELGSSSTFAGTSAAAPTVAAVAALALHAAPQTDPRALADALRATADPAVTSPYPPEIDPTRVVGAGLADAYALVESLVGPAPTPTSTPVPTETAADVASPARLAESGGVVPGLLPAALLMAIGLALRAAASRSGARTRDGGAGGSGPAVGAAAAGADPLRR